MGRKKSEMCKNLLKFNFDTFWGVYDQIVSSPLLYAIWQKNLKCEKNLKKFNFVSFEGLYEQIASSPLLGLPNLQKILTSWT